MIENVLATARANAKVDPVLAIWGWEIPVYLFLGGLTAGMMCFAAGATLLRREREAPFASQRLALWAPVVLSIGMGALFLDLEHKLNVFRFYTTLQPRSPMSWGSWVLVLVYPASIALAAATIRVGYPRLASLIERWRPLTALIDRTERVHRPLAFASLILGCALGIYTGVLLGAFSARPLWNSGLLGPLFLVSGLSTAAAVAMLGARESAERHFFARTDLALIAIEIALVALLLVDLATGSGPKLEALGLIAGGPGTFAFWALFVGAGLLAPLLLELGGGQRLAMLAAPLVLLGGYMLRAVMVEMGQASRWTSYAHQFDPTHLLGMQ